jgi:hypothetical protein
MTDKLDERTEPVVDKHPPLRLRSRRRILLPDLRPPTMEELRWAAEQRRLRRAAKVTPPRPPSPPATKVAAPDLPVQAEPVERVEPVTLPEPAPVASQLWPRGSGPAAPDVLAVEDEPVVEDVAVVDVATDEPDDSEVADVADVADVATDDDEPIDLPPREPVALDPVGRPPAVLEPAPSDLDPDETPRFARLRPRVVPPRRDPWTDRGPLIDDPDGEDVFDVEPSLDLDFHSVAPLRPPTPEAEPEPAVGPDIDVPQPRESIVEDEEFEDEVFDVAAVDLAPWRPPTGDDADEGPPLVSHLLIVREPRGSGSPRIAILDESGASSASQLVTGSVEVVEEPLEDSVDDVVADYGPTLAPDIEERYEPAPAVPKVWEGRPAPLYWRVLRLRHIRPNGWLRALFFEGSVAIAVVLVLAEAASVWTIVVLPLVVALIVKANDVLVGNLRRSYEKSGT